MPQRLRTNPRVVKRKMSSFPVKHREHRNWPRPTKTSAQAVVVVGAPEPAPITQQH